MNEEEKIEVQPTDDRPHSTENENCSDDSIQHTTLNIQPNEENMEVHKHPHHVTHKKKWGEYLLEFFMLFLAVFLGFVAENWREHMVENKKEMEYMHALSLDLKSDTALINHVKKYNEHVYETDSVILTLLNNPTIDSQTLDKLYRLNYISQNFDPRTNDSKTFDQLKSSGNYRLIRNEQVRSSIAKYYQLISVTKTFANEIQSELQLTYNLSFKIFDQYNFDHKPKTTVSLITNDVTLLKEYSSYLYSLQRSYKIYINEFLENIKKEAIVLIILLDKEYP